MSQTDGFTRLRPCIGCGAPVPDIDGPTHEYIGASPGCWAIYNEVLAKEYSDYRDQFTYGLSVDTYAVQHPGAPSRRSIQSVAVHLVSLLYVLEHDYSFQKATEVKQKLLQHREKFVWLGPPAWAGVLTILDVAQAKDLAEHQAKVKQWAMSVWQAWLAHHEMVRLWAALVS